MEPVARSVLVRSDLVDTSTTETPGHNPARGLTVTAVYHLSEAGRKASLLAGGDGHAVQRITIEVPANRLHLITVNGHGIARLKLRPQYDLPTFTYEGFLEELLHRYREKHRFID